MRILLTGGSGFLGSALKHKDYLPSGYEVIPYSQKDYANPVPSEIDLIIHCAGMTSTAACEKDPDLAYAANVLLTERLAATASKCGIRLVSTSTDLVFDGLKAPQGGFKESDEALAVSVYGKTKLQAEQCVMELGEFGSIIRLSLLYGPAFGENRGALGWICDGFRSGRGPALYSDEWRTPLYALDAVELIWKIANDPKASGVFHAAGSERLTRTSFGNLVAENLGFNPSSLISLTRAEHPQSPARPEDVSLNCQATCTRMTWQPRTIKEALSDIKKFPGRY